MRETKIPHHNYIPKMQQRWESGALPHDVGLHMVDVAHDDWCGIWQQERCNCDPNLRLKCSLSGNTNEETHMTDLFAPCTTLSDLWHRFAAEHAIVWHTLTYDAYATHAPTFGPWLMQRLSLAAPGAHVLWEMIWASLTAQPWRALKAHIVVALVEAGARCWATPFTAAASGFEVVYVAAPGLLPVLQIVGEEDVEEAARRLNDGVVAFSRIDSQTGLGVRADVPVLGQDYFYGVRFQDLVGHVALFSTLPACQAYTEWYVHEFMPAYMRHGWYDPTTGHAPPPGQELTALERREQGRDLLNAVVPGMGDVGAGQRPSTAEGRRLWWHRIVDEDGHEEFINDADLPNEEEA